MGDDLLAAAVLYGGAQWPIYANADLNVALERKKTDCYGGWAATADHHVEAVEVPYGDRTLAGWFHLPIGHDPASGPVPCVVAVCGMDGFKELGVLGSADRYLRRGLAVLSLDVPGQGTSLVREIWYEPDRMGEVGVAAYGFAAARAEVDAPTDPEQTLAHLDAVAGPEELLLYAGEDHAPVTRRSGQLGPAVFLHVVDWLADRAQGRPAVHAGAPPCTPCTVCTGMPRCAPPRTDGRRRARVAVPAGDPLYLHVPDLTADRRSRARHEESAWPTT